MKAKNILAIICALMAGRLAEAAIEFSGYLQNPTEIKFILTDTDDKTSSGWIVLGQIFNGYTITGFNRSAEMLSLKKGEEVVQLRLKTSKVKDAGPSEPGASPTNDPTAEDLKDGHHLVTAGDTAAKIAKTFKLTVAELFEMNPGVVWSRLRVGQSIKITK